MTAEPRLLAAALRDAVEGEVRFSPGDRHLYATDASNFRQVPVGVVVPRTVADVVATHEVCRAFGVPLTSRGGGTSLAGQATNAAVVVDTSKYLRAITGFDPQGRTVTCEPGIVLDTLLAHTQDAAQLTWGPDPSTHDRCTVGGMIGNNACGVHAYAYGRTVDNVAELDVLLYDGTRMTVGATSEDELERIVRSGGRKGEIHRRLRDLRDRYADEIRARFPDIPRRVSGYNLDELLPENGFHVARALVGSEGTCATVLHATLALNHHLPARRLVVLGYPDVYAAGDHVGWIRRHADAIAIEGLDRELLDNVTGQHLHADVARHLPAGDGWLLVELGGDSQAEADDRAYRFLEALRADGTADGWPAVWFADDLRVEAQVWRVRKAGLGISARFQGTDRWAGWEDSAVHPDDLGRYLRDLRGLFDAHGLHGALYGHFGDGCVHCRIDFDLASAPGVAAYRRFLDEAADLVSSYGGSYSGEHGDGQQRGPLLEKMFGPEIVAAFREFKAVWDPDHRMNPGKLVDAHGVDEHLRLGPDLRLPVHTDLAFGYPDDGGSFARAQTRCVGVGACRRDDGTGTMCPSYMVTHEEQHSTRGRARLLFEMLRPDAELDGWRDESVREALDLCLSCKGCTSECPVNVDIPTYKAEFLHHHYAGRLRPRAHYALGRIDLWSRLAAALPGLANLALGAPGLGSVLKRAAGVTTQRAAPRYAARTFRDWFASREPVNVGRERVLLFPDTFTNVFHPEVGRATVAVLEDAGYHVTIPERLFCCGRPLYDYGLLDLAGRYLDRLVALLRDDVAAGVRIVGMEPSCLAVLRGELTQMRPHDPDARRIAEATVDLAEFLTEVAGYDFPTLDRRAIVHEHCHHKGGYGTAAFERALDLLGLDWRELDAGCCGLAGSFGFEAGERFDVSVRAGERKLLPAVRDAAADTLIVSDGFSCRTQIAQLQQRNGAGEAGPRRALHLAQLVLFAREQERGGGAGGPVPIEQAVVGGDDGAGFTWRDTLAVAVAGAGALAAGAAWSRRRTTGRRQSSPPVWGSRDARSSSK